jgi:hypothetical protein
MRLKEKSMRSVDELPINNEGNSSSRGCHYVYEKSLRLIEFPFHNLKISQA